MHYNRARFNFLWGGTVASLGVAASFSPLSLAQVVPDNTLGAEGSRVVPNVLIRGALGDRIDGGALRGSNLFHSFSQFNVNDGQRVYFSNPAGIENILSRVTGGDVSDIMGTLGVDGGANLYLLNPNGIIFGPNAQLDIAGSFVASTGSAFIFPNGEVFSAVDPQAPPLLTINVPVGIQYGANPQGLIRNEGILSVRGDLTLDAGRLELQGQLRAEGDLTLQAQDTLIIRDSVTAPFIASSGQNLLVQGNQSVDIFALNHPNSGLFAGNDLTLRSATPVIGDVHYWSGGNFRIEQLDESLGTLTSPNDPVIRAAGDVSFASYTGASLHIFAGGSVTVPGAITITGVDPLNGIVQTVTLSDGSTVNINGQTTPTLDIRAGTLAVNPVGAIGDTTSFLPGLPATGAGATSADITIGSILNPGGTVFLTNQYQPNLALGGGDIRVGAIDTSALGFVNEFTVRGGDVVIDGRGGIVITEADSVNTSANARVDISSSVNAIGDIEVEATGGAIRFLAQNAIGMGNPNASANANVQLFIDFPADGNQLAADRTIGDLTVMATGGRIAVESSTSAITTGDVNSSAFTYVFAGGLFLGIGTGIDFGDTTVTTTGGVISLESDTFTETGVINASTNANVNLDGAAWDADNINPSGGVIGDIILTTIGGTILLESGTFIRTDAIDSSSNADAGAGVEAIAFPFATTATATGGTIGNFVLDTMGGAIVMRSGTFITTNAINSSANANTFAYAKGDVDIDAGNAVETGGTIGDVTLTTTGGEITLELESGTFIRANTIDSSANANANVNANADTDVDANVVVVETGGQIGDVTLTTSGGTIDLESITSITMDSLNSAARSFADVNAGEDSFGGVVGREIFAATGGDIDLASESGEVTLSEGNSIRSNVLGGDGDGGDIQISGGSIQLTDNLLTTTVTGQGDAGDITIDVTGDATISGSRLLTGRESGADGTGAGGRIAITAGSIELTNFAFLNTATFSTGDAGDVFLETTEGDISLNSSSIFSLTAGQGNPGDISIDSAGALHLEGNSLISTAVALGVPNTANSVPGNITINAANRVEITGIGVVDQSTQVGTDPNLPSVEADTRETAQSIDDSFALLNNPDVLFPNEVPYVAVSASNNFDCPNACSNPFRTVSNSDFYSVEVTAVGTQITLDIDNSTTTLTTGTLNVDLNLYDSEGNLIASNASGPLSLGASGSTTTNDAFLTYIFNEPGTYFIEARSIHTSTTEEEYTARGDYTLNVSRVDDFLVSSGITTQTRSGIPSGDITINAPTINIQNGGQISAETLRDGQAGNITLQPFGNGQTLNLNIEGEGSQISSSTQSTGTGGNLILRALNSITLQGNGQLLAQTSGSGDAGDVRIETADLTIRNGVEVSTTTEGLGSGGSIFVSGINDTRADRVTINNAELSAETTGTAPAGDIHIRTGEFIMSNRAGITTTTTSSGDGGDIIIRADDLMRLDNSTILAESNPIDENGTVLTTTPGNAGQIQITTPQLFLRNRAQISASNVSSSSEGVSLQGLDRLQLGDRSTITASTQSGRAGNLTIFMADGGDIGLTGDSRIAAEATAGGSAGSLELNNVDQLTLLDSSGISVSATRAGNSGELTVDAQDVLLRNQSFIEATTVSGQGGSIFLNNLQTLRVLDSLISASTEDGIAGNLSVTARDSVLLRGTGLFDRVRLGGLTVAASQGGTAGNLTIETARLTIEDEATATVSSTLAGDSGNLTIEAREIRLNDRATIIAETQGGQGGNVSLRGADLLSLHGGSTLSASTRSGVAGDIDISMADGGDIRLTGRSRIAAEATGQQTNRVTPVAGNLTIQGDRLTVRGNSEITVSAPNGQAGSLTIRARSIELNNGEIRAETGFSPESGQGANIRLEDLDLLIMRNGSLISARALGDANGGNITIDAANGFIIASPFENNDIIATAEQGRGGNITISAFRVFGFSDLTAARFSFNELRANGTSDLSASSEDGVQGAIVFDTLNVDPSQGLAELPINLVDASQQITAGCGLGNNSDENEFIVTGRGGLPPSSGDPLTASAVDVPWVVADDITPNNVAPDNVVGLSATATDAPLVEAQGMWVDAEGNIHLVAEVETELTANPTAIANQFCAVSSH